ncbi:MAG: hypothetical protein IIY06_01940 [Proteobacteria bacterium]|jgi:hypothetical protein|nr:hypothetical protein [Pseudomonadota bacterium]
MSTLNDKNNIDFLAPITIQLNPAERWRVRIVAWTVSILFHVALFTAVSWFIDWRVASYEIKIAWSDAPLTGFGMMDVYEDGDMPEPEDVLEELEALAEDENPFEDDTDVLPPEPDLQADNIAAPPEPQEELPAEPGNVAEQEPKKERPSHDLARDEAKLAAVRKDMAGMPNLHVMAPGNAKLIVLIRNDRVQGSRFEPAVRRLFKSFPDYRFTLGTSDIDPITDIDAMLIATANPALYAETFLVVSHKIAPKVLKKAIDDSFPTDIKWEEYDSHPLATPDVNDGRFNPRSGIYKRSVFIPNDHTVLFLKPEVLPTLNVPHLDAIVAKRDDDADSPEEAKTFLDSLGIITTSDSPSMPTLFFALQGIEGIALGPSFPKFTPPVFIQASLSTAANPHLNLSATFKTPEEASEFNALWPDIIKAAASLGIPGLGGLLGALALTADGQQVLISGDLNGNMISLILMFASSHLQNA